MDIPDLFFQPKPLVTNSLPHKRLVQRKEARLPLEASKNEQLGKSYVREQRKSWTQDC